MNAQTILDELKSLGSETTKKTLMRHGAREPFFGVKVEHLKKIQKRIKKDYQLALDLYDTGVSDAMYLAGLIADDDKMTKKDLQRWADGAYWYMISEFTVPWVAASGQHGWEMGNKWIEAKKESIAAAGWATLSSLVGITDDADLDLPALKKLLERVAKTIHQQPNRVRGAMNNFVICMAAFVKPLNAFAKEMANKIGKVAVDVGDTSCKVPFAPEYIKKIEARRLVGQKRKSAKC